MGLLNAVVGGIAGGVAGVGAGLTEISKQWNDRDLDAAKQQAEIQKEKRIEEAVIRSEVRASANKAGERQAELDFSTDPNNRKRLIDAKLEEQTAEDEYKDGRVEIDAKRAGLLARAQHIEDVDRGATSREDAHLAAVEVQNNNAKLRLLKDKLINAKTEDERDGIERQIRIETKGTSEEKGKFTRHQVMDEVGMPTGEYEIFNTNTGESIRQSSPNADKEYPVPTPKAIAALRERPELKADFIAKYGRLPAGMSK